MALFDRFRSSNKKSVLPSEVDAYYKSEAREKKSVAVLLGVVTLVGTLLLAALIFFGGRAIYRSFNDADTKTDTAQTEKKDDNSAAQQGAAPQSTQSGNSTGQSGQGTSSNQGSGSGTSSPPRTAPNPNNTPSSTPALGDEPSPAALPHTGDEGM